MNKINNNSCNNFRDNAFSFKRYSGWRKRCHLFNLFTESNFCQKNSDGRYPDPYNCCKFIRCFSGIPQRRSCPLGLMFNRTLKTCDWPQNVRCQGKPVTDRVLAISSSKQVGEYITGVLYFYLIRAICHRFSAPKTVLLSAIDANRGFRASLKQWSHSLSLISMCVFLFFFFLAQIPDDPDGDWINGIYTGCHLSKTINKITEKVCG